MSKLVETYNRSIFANIGNTVSKMQAIKIPDDIKIGEFKTKGVLDLQKDFFKEVVLPYGTILEEQSNFGKIIVNPTKSIVDLFTKITHDVNQLVVISADSNLLKLSSIYDDIKDPNKTYLLDSTVPTLNSLDTTSVLNFNTTDINLLHTTPLLESDTQDHKEFETTSVLKFNSKFDDIIEFKTTSVLDFNSKFNDIVELPYSNVLNLSSKFDDLIIKDIGSVLKIYVASNLPSTVPGVVDFFENIYATGFTPDLQKGQSLYDVSKISPYNVMPDTPNKQIGEIVEMSATPNKEIIDIVPIPETPEKTLTDIVEMPATPEKNAGNIVEMPDTPTKPISDINPPAETLEKMASNIIEMPGTPTKNTETIIGITDTPEKFISQLNSPPEVPEKIKFIADDADFPNRYFMGDVVGKNPNTGIVNFIPDLYAFGFTRNLQPYITQFKLDYGDISYDDRPRFGKYTIPSNWAQLHQVNFIPDVKADGFTLGALEGQTKFKLTRTFDEIGNETTYVPSQWAQTIDLDEKFSNIQDRYDNKVYPFGGTDDKALYQFNWNIPPGYPGVLNQYAVYFSKYPPLTNVTYKTVIDWAYNQIIRVPQAQTLYNQGFHTPLVPIGTTSLIIPPYKYANDRLPTWANIYTNTLSDVGSTLVAGFLSQQTIDLLDRLTDADLQPWKKSPVVFHQLAGEVYWTTHDLGSAVRNSREWLINQGSNLFGRTLTEYFVPKIESAIGNVVSSFFNSAVEANLLNDDKVLMLYHILMGTKYTKSKAFFDRLAVTYNSKYSATGDNAVNLYTLEYKYSDGGKTLDRLNAINYAIPYVKDVTTAVDELFGVDLTISSYEYGQLKNILSLAKSGIDTTLIPIGLHPNTLENRFLMKKDSKTFGTYTEDRNYYSSDTPIESRTYVYDGPPLTDSINKNYPETPTAKSDLNALTVDTLADFEVKSVLKNIYNDFSAAHRAINDASREDSYSSLMKNKVRDKLLESKGFPSYESQFSDKKNRLNMIQMPQSDDADNVLGIEKYEDKYDLIDFYFEDLSSFSDAEKRESIVIPFKAILTTLSDGTNANWAAQDYMGRADKFWIYQGFDRRVAINFEVAINSKDEFISSWNKINYLQGMCYPVEYPAEISLKAPIMALTVGNLFERIQVIMNSINYSFDGSTLWEIEPGFQLPMYIKIAVDFTVIYADTPKAASRHIGQSQEWMKPKIFSYDGDNKQTSKNKVDIVETVAGKIIPKKENIDNKAAKDALSKTPVGISDDIENVNRFSGGGFGPIGGGGW